MTIIPHEFDFLAVLPLQPARPFSTIKVITSQQRSFTPDLAGGRDQIVFIFPAQRFGDRFRFRFGFRLIQQIDLVEHSNQRGFAASFGCIFPAHR